MDRNLLLAFALSFLVLSLWSMTQPRPERVPLGEAPRDILEETARTVREPESDPGTRARYPELPPARSEPQLPETGVARGYGLALGTGRGSRVGAPE